MAKLVAPASGRTCTTTPTSTEPSQEQGSQLVLERSGSGDNNLAPLDLQTPTVFENNYYKNLVCNKGLLHSDQELFNGGATDAQVQSYVISSQSAFFADFVMGMIKMGDITPLTGSNGEIRKNCRRTN